MLAQRRRRRPLRLELLAQIGALQGRWLVVDQRRLRRRHPSPLCVELLVFRKRSLSSTRPWIQDECEEDDNDLEDEDGNYFREDRSDTRLTWSRGGEQTTYGNR